MAVDETVILLQSLGDEPVRPPMVDLNLAMRTGRQRRHRRRLAASAGSVLGVVAVIAAAPVAIHGVRGKAPASVIGAGSPSAGTAAIPSPSVPAAPASLNCVESRLPVPKPGQEGLVTGADPSGRFIVGRVYNGGRPAQVAIWDNGKITTSTIPGDDAELVDITSEGVAVGESYVSGTVPTAWIYANGHLTKLPGPAGSSPVAINDQGLIGGTQESTDSFGYPIVWHSATSNPVRLPLPPGSTLGGSVADVDSDGTIVGSVIERPGPELPHDVLSRGVVWRPDGSVDLLPLPTDLVDGVNGFEIHSIRNGVITAAATVSTATGKTLTPVTYDLSTGKFTRLPGANLWIGTGNAEGGIAGDADENPAVYTPATGVVALPTLLKTRTTPFMGGLAKTISDNGRIIGGQDMDENNVITAVMWTCQ